MEYVKRNGFILTVEQTKSYLSDGSEFSIDDGYLSIHVNEEHRGNGLAALLIHSLLSIRTGDRWYKIDGDASGGFWNHVGMREGRYGYMVYTRPTKSTRWHETEGGEKSITFQDLYNWSKKNIMNRSLNT